MYNFSKIKIPLLNLQKDSFFNFITNKESNVYYCLNNLLKNLFPIFNNIFNIYIDIIDYYYIESNSNFDDIKILNKTFEFYLFLILNIKQVIFLQDSWYIFYDTIILYYGSIPFMLKNGSFLINGDEKAVVHQIQRSPGIYFSSEDSLKKKNCVKIIPKYGSWLTFEISNDKIFVKIDNHRKFLFTTILFSLNFNENMIKNFFNCFYNIYVINFKFYIKFKKEYFLNEVLKINLFLNNICIFKKGYILNIKDIIWIEKLGIKFFQINKYDLFGYKLFNSLEILNIKFFKNDFINKNFIFMISFLKNINFKVYYDNKLFSYIDKIINNTLNSDLNNNFLKANEFFNVKILNLKSDINEVNFIENKFFDQNHYNLSILGRFKLNYYLEYFTLSLTLSVKDLIETVKKLIYFKKNLFIPENNDSLINRSIKFINELLYEQYNNTFNLFLKNLELFFNSSFDLYCDSRKISKILYDFFNVNSICQFLDQVNALSEVSHKRRITALGSGGINSSNSSFEIRDVNYSYYGKICPIETPEGPNIGLINSFSLFSKQDNLGYILSPYYLILDGKITNIIHYISSKFENNFIIAQFTNEIDNNGNFIKNKLLCRYFGDFNFFNKKLINYMDYSSQQILSLSASLVPFLGHNDANRVLMGCNMQKQSLPLLFTKNPLVKTSNESNLIIDSYYNIYSKNDGYVYYLDSYSIIISSIDKKKKDIYFLSKYERSNQNTLIHHTVIVNLNDIVKKGDLLAESNCSCNNELSLGKNVRVAFMPYYGYNFEDAIVASDRLIKEDVFTSFHVYDVICEVKNTDFGYEELTNEIVSINKDYLCNLDQDGIIKIGSIVKINDVLVGKLAPLEFGDDIPENRLLNMIFYKKIKRKKNTSLYVPKNMNGEILDVILIKNSDFILKDDKYKFYELWNNLFKSNISNYTLSYKLLDLPWDILKSEYNLIDKNKELYDLCNLNKNVYKLPKIYNINNFKKNVICTIKIKIGVKRKLKVGDKFSGRYGNKGVISKIVSVHDMPYDSKGNPIDIILNPLGVPSRMNIGQLIEVFLSKYLQEIKLNFLKYLKFKNYKKIYNYYNFIKKKKYIQCTFKINEFLFLKTKIESFLNNHLNVSIPAFININLNNLLKLNSSKIILFDGKTGNKFEHEITVGFMYMMKLNHLSDDKIHARSIGSYSLITQQPLGGKSQFGGQRFGEMEVWALEAYGSAYILNEMLTVKSDDLEGRIKLYKNLIMGEEFTETTSTESFNILINEIRSLGFDIKLVFNF